MATTYTSYGGRLPVAGDLLSKDVRVSPYYTMPALFVTGLSGPGGGNAGYIGAGGGKDKGIVTFGLDDDTVVTNAIGKFGNVQFAGSPFVASLSCVTGPTTADAIFDVLKSHDNGATFTSIFEKSRSWATARPASTIEIATTLRFMGNGPLGGRKGSLHTRPAGGRGIAPGELPSHCSAVQRP